MYFVPDGTKVCGFYECENCKMRFLSLKIVSRMECPYCGEEQLEMEEANEGEKD